MTSVDDVVESIKSGPSGPDIAAIFDFDGTLIEGYSATALYSHRARNFEIGPDELVRTVLAGLRGTPDEAGFTDLMERGIRGWAGRTEEERSSSASSSSTTRSAARSSMAPGGWSARIRIRAIRWSSPPRPLASKSRRWHGNWGSNTSDVIVIAIAGAKIRLVGRHFMELRDAPFALRSAFDIWTVAVSVLIIGFTVSG